MKKRHLFSICAVASATVLCLGFVSCKDDDNEENGNGGGKVIPSREEAMTPQDQQSRIAATALDLIDMVPASDFEPVVTSFNEISEILDHAEDSVLDAWSDGCLAAAIQMVRVDSTDTEQTDYGTYSRFVKNYNTYAEALIYASAFTGIFTLEDNAWTYTGQSDDLQFRFNDVNSKPCVIRLRTEGTTTPLHISNNKDYDYKYYVDANNNIYESHFNTETRMALAVPEKAVLTVIQNSVDIIKVTLNVKLDNLDGDEFDISSSSISSSMSAELNNGYCLNVSKLAVTDGEQMEVAVSLLKNSSPLLSVSGTAGVSGLASVYVGDILSGKVRENPFKDFNLSDVNLNVDILGSVQVKGTLADAMKLSEYVDQIKGFEGDTVSYAAFIDDFNSMFDLGIYYDGKDVKQADFCLQLIESETEAGTFVLQPCLAFYDGSETMPLLKFIATSEFMQVMSNASTLIEDYKTLFGEEITEK